MQTRLTEKFDIRFPIVSAPMALVSGGRLAAAVTDAGGLGLIGGGYAGTIQGEPGLAAELEHVRGRRFGVGFITWALEKAPHKLDEALAHQPACVFLSFGDPRPFARSVRDTGARLICQVQSLRHVEEAVDAGADCIVAQGTEAGGHGGGRSTLPFVPEVADVLRRRSPDTLLLAAGGIADGRGLAAALMLGADGVVVGSRFWACEEALTPSAAVERAVASSGDQTVRTRAIDALRGVSWPEEFSFRVVENALTREWAHRESEAVARYGSLARAYDEARARGDMEMVATVAGEAVGLIHGRPPAAAIVEDMVAHAREHLQRGCALDFR